MNGSQTMNSYPLNGIDSKLISKILNDEVYFESEINYLARLEEFHGAHYQSPFQQHVLFSSVLPLNSY